ncbi:hypothetical protein [Winogradskyella poriferorum]|jgi:hypothetical protein|uniref:hypothetical protein n=1 Tax=Winogradskyella poriferorum TaxID=307627 RepID=UPI003D64A70E
MNKILVYILIFLTFSCVDKKERISINTDSAELKTEPIVETKKSDSLFIDPNDFKYSNLKEFDLRNWYIGKMDEELKSPTKEKLVNYIQNERLTLENVYPNSWKYFSIQKNEELEKIITIIEGDESCCSDLHYLVYNEQNELLSDNIIAGTGGDGMWAYDQYGKFINDSTYILTRIDMEEIELANGGTKTQIDSVITNYRFYKNKPFKKLTEQKFKKVEKH